MQMLAMDGLYLCALAAVGAGQGAATAQPPQLVSPSLAGRDPRWAQLPDMGLTLLVWAMMQWDNFYRESAHF